jgi:hypothetical protein
VKDSDAPIWDRARALVSDGDEDSLSALVTEGLALATRPRPLMLLLVPPCYTSHIKRYFMKTAMRQRLIAATPLILSVIVLLLAASVNLFAQPGAGGGGDLVSASEGFSDMWLTAMQVLLAAIIAWAGISLRAGHHGENGPVGTLIILLIAAVLVMAPRFLIELAR